MKKALLTTILSFIVVVVSFGQTIVRGKITDENGAPLIGVTVVLKSNGAVGTVSDFDGNFSLILPDASPQILVVTYLSYQTIEESIRPAGAVFLKNFGMIPASTTTINEVVVTAKAVKSKEYYVEKLKMNSATTVDYVSSETMKKVGDANVVNAVKRVAGVSTNGDFITVRGIGDRYVKTAFNGSVIPTLDPFTNNIKLDMFPASLVDNVIITKTASPDLPGDWAGAYLSVQTKDYPEEFTINAESSFGYNNQTTFKNVISSDRSSTDWLGYDNGFRNHDHSNFILANESPTQYQQLTALGLGNYYHSMGITGWVDNVPPGDTYYKLGLVQLGLLAPAQFNDQTAVKNADATYKNGSYANQAFNSINAAIPALSKSFADNWDPVVRTAPMNFSQTFSIGNQVNIFGKPLGFLAGFRYGSYMTYDGDAHSGRLDVGADQVTQQLKLDTVSYQKQQSSKEVNSWSALMNIALKLNPNNSISFLFMPNFTGTNQVTNAVDSRVYNDYLITKSQFYEERKQLIYQAKSENYIPSVKAKVELNASYTDGKSSAPDFKNVQYSYDPVNNTYQIGPTYLDGINRYYRYLSDDVFDSKLSVELPIDNKPGLTRKIKFGGAYQRTDKKYDQYDYMVYPGPYSNISMTNNSLNDYLSLNHFDIRDYTDNAGLTHRTIDLYYLQNDNPSDHTFGNSTIKAAFGMLDYAIVPRLRFSGGVRVEQSNLFTDVDRYDSLGLPANDIRRDYSTAYPAANPGKLNETDVLPSGNLIYKLRNDEETPVNLRMNYSKTIARPSLRELSSVNVYDYELKAPVYGNPDLQAVHIDNYDLRAESYFKSGDNVSVSFFYKNFKNHIELVNSNGYTWQNVDKSWVKGIELEGRKVLTKHFEFIANLTLDNSHTEYVRMQSEISGGIEKLIPEDTVRRVMFGQAPYVINAMLTYKADSLGLTASVSYNVQGERLIIASNKPEIPDVYELPAHMIDMKLTKTIGKHFGASFAVRNILNSSVEKAYVGSDGKPLLDYGLINYGVNYIFSVSYKL